MKPIRLMGVAALALGTAGCASTGPTAKVSAPDLAAKAPETKTENLPEYVETAPVVEAAPAAPSIDIGSLDSVEPQPAYVIESPGYAETVPLRSRSMAPIYDDPEDNSPDRTASISSRKANYRPTNTGAAKPPNVRNAYTPAFGAKLARAAESRLNPNVRYDARYVKIGFPWGDVPESTGVCTDVVIRSYRALGVDLQSLVHEDMRNAFSVYPSQRIYGLREADPNIDHRRVVNLEAFFERVGASVPATMNPEDYQAGDIVTWRLSGNEPHTGIVSANRDPRTGNPLVIHNLGAGVREEDMLFLSPPIGHYRFAPDQQTRMASLVLGR